MATKLFKESDSWGELSGNGSSLNFASRKNIKVKDKKKRKKRKHSEISDDLKSEGGKWVKYVKKTCRLFVLRVKFDFLEHLHFMD